MLPGSTNPIPRQGCLDAGVKALPVVTRMFGAALGAQMSGNRGRGVLARLIVIGLTIHVIAFGEGCRSPGPDYSAPSSVDAYPSESSRSSRPEALLRAEAANMAVEDQKRAQQGYERMPKKKYPPRDYPIQPVIRP